MSIIFWIMSLKVSFFVRSLFSLPRVCFTENNALWRVKIFLFVAIFNFR